MLLRHGLTAQQMAKKMKFSVVGLPHYTIWHLYEPSVEDLKHMEVCTYPPFLADVFVVLS